MQTKHIYKYNRWQLDSMVVNCQKIVMVGQDSEYGTEPTIWVEHGPDDKPREFVYYGTGHAIPLTDTHVASCRVGPFIWHVYEVEKL